jgi:hypothetical protein
LNVAQWTVAEPDMMRKRPTLDIPARCHSWRGIVLVGLLTGCSSDPPVVDSVDERANKSSEMAVGVDHAYTAGVATDADLLSVPEPSPSEPVTAAMKIRSESAPSAGTFEILVFVRIARAHYLHAANKSGEPFIPVSINLPLPQGFEALGDWQFPPPEKTKANTLGFRNSIVLRRSLKVLSTAPSQTMIVTGELRYQVCTDELCWPPGKIELTSPLPIRSQPR